MKRTTWVNRALVFGLCTAPVGCDTAQDDDIVASPGSGVGAAGKADSLDGTTYLIEGVAEGSEIEGRFSEEIRGLRVLVDPQSDGPLRAEIEVLEGSASGIVLQLVDSDGGVLASGTSFDFESTGQDEHDLRVQAPAGSTAKVRVSVQCVGACGSPPSCGGALYYLPDTKIRSGTTTWDYCDVHVLGYLQFANSYTELRVRPGTRVWADDRIVVSHGAWLSVEGTTDDPVEFHFDESRAFKPGLYLDNTWNPHEVRFLDVSGSNHALYVDLKTTRWNQRPTLILEDSIFRGVNTTESEGYGIKLVGGMAELSKTLVEGFPTGISIHAEEVAITDSVVRNNATGISASTTLTGTICGSEIPDQQMPYRDPIIVASDLYDNGTALFVGGDELLFQIYESNLRDNYTAIELRGTEAHPASEVKRSNITDDTDWSPMVRASYRGTEFEDIYWGRDWTEQSVSEDTCGIAASIIISNRSPRDTPVSSAGPELSILRPEIADAALGTL